MFRRKRKGMVLITVVLISALLFVSIIGITLKVVPENKIIAARSASQRALEAAETGLSQVAFDIRNINFENTPYVIEPTDHFHYLTEDEVAQLPKRSISNTTPINTVHDCLYSSGPPYIIYKVKILKTGGYVNFDWTPDTIIGDNNPIYITINAMGIVSKDSSTTPSSILARRVVSADYVVYFSKQPRSPVSDYALFTGGKVNFNAGCDVTISGDIFSNDSIKFTGGNNTIIDITGAVNAVGSVTKTPTAGDYSINPGVDQIPFPKIDLQHYEEWANAFKTGDAPYDGSDPERPNTSVLNAPQCATILGEKYLGNSDPIVGIQNFYNDLMNDDDHGDLVILGPILGDLESKAKYIVYYVDNNGQVKQDTNFICEGTIVINGNFTINSGANINKDVVPDPYLSILVKDDIIVTNDDVYLTGMFYSEKNIRFTGQSQLHVKGSLVVSNDISLNNIASIEYVDLSTLDTDVNPIVVLRSAEQTTSSWKEISFDGF